MSKPADLASLAIHLDYGVMLVRAPQVAQVVAEVLLRPCFADLSRLSARQKDRWTQHTKPSAASIVAYLSDPANDAISMDTKRGGELVAGAQVDNGTSRPTAPAPETRFSAYIVVPVVAAESQAHVAAACDLAAAVSAAAGFVTVEPRFGLAHRTAVGGFQPKERPGLSEQRRRERLARADQEGRLATELAGIEWGTFLGPGHLGKIDLHAVRDSGAFARVVEVTPQVAYLQVTEDPLDELTDAFEEKLQAARRALSPLLMDVSSVSIE